MAKQIVGVLPTGMCKACGLTRENHRLVFLSHNESDKTVTFKITNKEEKENGNSRGNSRSSSTENEVTIE